MRNKVDILVGLQYGSEGKGLIAGHLASTGVYDTVVNCNMPNAGHTYITTAGKEYIFKVLPNGAIFEHVERVMLGPDSVFNTERLMEEMLMVGGNIWDKLIIHENATLLRPEHAIAEASLQRIGSTKQGSAAAMIDKIMRIDSAVSKFDPDTLYRNVVTQEQWMEELRDAGYILLEGCQGYSLGLNAGFYPYCTSRDCTPTRLLAGAGIPYQWARKVIGAARLHPIRVGGSSGPGYPDQRELDWADIGQAPEFTTVTNRQRRLFEYSYKQTRDAILACQPNEVFLNFCNYDEELSKGIKREINTLLRQYGPSGARVAYTGWGPKDCDVRYEG